MPNESFYRLIPFPSSDTQNGTLFMYQEEPDAIPFVAKRVLVMKGMKKEDARGGHTHHRTQQVLVALQGGCTVDLDNGSEKAQVTLATADTGLLLSPLVWHTMRDFEPDTILMVIANTLYDEKDYIRSYEEFQKTLEQKPNL